MKLRDYQEATVQKGHLSLMLFNIVYLALETRLGKTLTSMTIAERFGAKNVLFATKKKAKTSVEKDYKLGGFKFNITIENYEQVKKLKPVYDLIIIDEAHNFATYPKTSNRWKEMKRICKEKPLIYLSATPTPESYSQIFHQLHLSDFSPFRDYKNFYKWAADFVEVKKKRIGAHEVNDYTKANIDMIKPLLDDFMISMTQKEAGFKQEIKEYFITVKMKPVIKNLITILKKDRVFTGSNGGVITCDTPVKLMSKCHQICSGSVILDDGSRKVLDTAKAGKIADMIGSQKVAIFYKFQSEYDILVQQFGKDKLTQDQDIFNSRSDLIFVSQVISGREGVNLSTADALFFLNIDHASLSYIQTKNRIQAKDREKEAVIYWIFSDTGIEEDIYKAVSKKQKYTSKHFMRSMNNYAS